MTHAISLNPLSITGQMRLDTGNACTFYPDTDSLNYLAQLFTQKKPTHSLYYKAAGAEYIPFSLPISSTIVTIYAEAIKALTTINICLQDVDTTFNESGTKCWYATFSYKVLLEESYNTIAHPILFAKDTTQSSVEDHINSLSSENEALALVTKIPESLIDKKILHLAAVKKWNLVINKIVNLKPHLTPFKKTMIACPNVPFRPVPTAEVTSLCIEDFTKLSERQLLQKLQGVNSAYCQPEFLHIAVARNFTRVVDHFYMENIIPCLRTLDLSFEATHLEELEKAYTDHQQELTECNRSVDIDILTDLTEKQAYEFIIRTPVSFLHQGHYTLAKTKKWSTILIYLYLQKIIDQSDLSLPLASQICQHSAPIAINKSAFTSSFSNFDTFSSPQDSTLEFYMERSNRPSPRSIKNIAPASPSKKPLTGFHPRT